MRHLSNLPPGVTDQMVEDAANPDPSLYEVIRKVFDNLWESGHDGKQLAFAFAEVAVSIVREENPSDLEELRKVFDIGKEANTTKWKVIAPGIIELPNTKMQIRYEASAKHPYFNVLYDGLPIPSNQHGRLDHAQAAGEAHMAKLIAMGFDN